MSCKITNFTAQLVVKEIENVLDEYPKYPYQLVFAIPALHQKLIAYILCKTPNYYTVYDSQNPLNNSNYPYFCLPQRGQIQDLIYGGIFEIVHENLAWIRQPLPQQQDSG